MVLEQQWQDAILEELAARGLSRSDYADLLGVSVATVSVYLDKERKGKRKYPKPGPDLMERWLSVLGLEVSLRVSKVAS